MTTTEVEGLDDGLDYSYDVSDGETGGVAVGSGDEVTTINKSEDEENKDESDSDEKKDTNKDDDDENDLVKLAMKTENGDSNSKKRKHKNDKLAEKKRLKMEYDVQQKKDLARQTPDIIAEKLAQKLGQHLPDLSPLELSELYINKNAIKDTSEFTEDRTLINFEKFVNEYFKEILPADGVEIKKKKNRGKKGKKSRMNQSIRKFVLVLSMSALRACDMHRATRAVPGSSMKLINKNKIQDDLKFLQTTRCRVLAGTAGRVDRILNEEESPLKMNEIVAIVCDSSYLDTKKQNLWDLKENLQLISRITKANSDAKVYLY